MSDIWHRQRRPDEVPTPIAVALSDYCRRASAPAPAPRIREALALISHEEDFRVRALTDQEPEARPLGPFALIDILRGTSPALAAQRETVGYYELVRQLADLRESPPPAPTWVAPSSPAPLTRAAERLLAAPASQEAVANERAPSVQERIAPVRRAAEPTLGSASAPSGRRKELPPPRGRFTQVPTTKRALHELRSADTRGSLEALVEQHPHRFALHRALAEQYSGSARGPLSEEDALDALRTHGVLATLERKERQAILAGYAEHRGATSRVSWGLDLSPSELGRLEKALALHRDVEEVRERFRREALAPHNLSYRLDLLGRARYLSDLGIQRRFTESLTADLRGLLQGARRREGGGADLLQTLSRQHGVSHELLERAFDKLGLSGELQRKVTGRPS